MDRTSIGRPRFIDDSPAMRPNVALVASDAPNATLGALDAPNATLGRSPRPSTTLRRVTLGVVERCRFGRDPLGHQAELVAFRILQRHPRAASDDARPPSAEPEQPGEFLILSAIGGANIEVQAVLRRLRLVDADEQDVRTGRRPSDRHTDLIAGKDSVAQYLAPKS